MSEESGEDNKEPVLDVRLPDSEEESDEQLIERLSKKKVGDLLKKINILVSID